MNERKHTSLFIHQILNILSIQNFLEHVQLNHLDHSLHYSIIKN